MTSNNNVKMEDKIITLAAIMKKSKNTMILTGAGMDTESNIPDFRSRSGWWRNIDPREVATREALKNNYSLFHDFYSYRIKKLFDVNPHEGHYVLAKFEEQGIINSIATQNVSGLHRKAGSKEVYELHGNINIVNCDDCKSDEDINNFLNRGSCEKCNSEFLRPRVILFGESLPEEVWSKTLSNLNKIDLLIVIGTSLAVYPVNELPRMFNGFKVYINNEESLNYNYFDLTIIGKAKDILIKLDEEISKSS